MIILEWIWCLLSKKHARNTYLRITPEDEEKYIAVIYAVAITLFISSLFIWHLAYLRYMENRTLQRRYQPFIIYEDVV